MPWLQRGAAFCLVLFATVAWADATRHTIDADGHPVAVWEKSADDAREAILLVHGRTWSAPVPTSRLAQVT
jgi:hypothetical protein